MMSPIELSRTRSTPTEESFDTTPFAARQCEMREPESMNSPMGPKVWGLSLFSKGSEVWPLIWDVVHNGVPMQYFGRKPKVHGPLLPGTRRRPARGPRHARHHSKSNTAIVAITIMVLKIIIYCY